LKAVRRAINEFNSSKNLWVAQLDIDNYFDTINHEILFRRLKSIIYDAEILRLIDLSVKMGVVGKNKKWTDVTEGVPQGAVLSPVLSNFYLHSFDQYMTSKTTSYIRYADDFLFFSDSKDKIEGLSAGATLFLKDRLLCLHTYPSFYWAVSLGKTGKYVACA